MFSLSSLDVYFLVKELKSLLDDSFIDKIYQSADEKGEFLIRMRSPAAGKQQLFIQAPDAVFLTEHRYEWPKEPLGFCMQLRKHLSNSKLVSVEQHAFERIIILSFQKGSTSWKLILELFSKGNVVLVNAEGLIRGVLDLQRWKDRTLRVNAPYEFPPGKVDTSLISLDQLKSLFADDGRELVKFCATTLSLGGKYAEELIARSGLDKNAAQLSDEQVKVLHSSLRDMLALGVEACLYGDDAAPFPLQTRDDPVISESFSAAIESLVVGDKHDVIADAQERIVVSRADKYQRIIDEQTNKLKGYEQSAQDNQRKGELIYERYQEIGALLKKLNELRADGGWDAVRSFIAEHQYPITVDEHSATIILDVK